MTNSITTCQANALLALQRDLMESGLTVTVGECATSCTTTPGPTRKTAAAPTVKKRKYTKKTPTTATTTTSTSAGARKMSRAGRKAIAASSGAYHARIKELREAEHLTLKQARARYQELKEDGAL